MEGWIKLHRKVLEWEWFKEDHMFKLFMYLILSANHETKNWKGIEIKRGQIVTGRKSLSDHTGISQRSIRTCLNRLKTTNELTIKTTNKYSIITICNYEKYQIANHENDQVIDQQNANKRPASDHKQEYKELKNKKKITAYSEEFLLFYAAYPKHVAKDDAARAWSQMNGSRPPLATLLDIIEKFKQTEQWKKDNGKYIPLPATWLRGKRWEDELPSAPDATRRFSY